MNKTSVKKKIKDLEAEISLLKNAVSERPNFEIDERNWDKVKRAVKKARAEVAKEVYG